MVSRASAGSSGTRGHGLGVRGSGSSFRARKQLRAHFVEFVAARYGPEAGAGADGAGDGAGVAAAASDGGVSMRDVRLLTAVHFFSIVPLHDVREHQAEYLRMCESLLREEGLLA